MRYYAVFDTNVLVSSLLTKKRDSATALVVDAIADGVIVPLYSREVIDEYEDVLHRPKFPFNRKTVRNLIDMIRQFGRAVSPENSYPKEKDMPDQEDVIFYRVVMERRADGACLITGNLRHFPKEPFIVTPAEMLQIIRKGEMRHGES